MARRAMNTTELTEKILAAKPGEPLSFFYRCRCHSKIYSEHGTIAQIERCGNTEEIGVVFQENCCPLILLRGKTCHDLDGWYYGNAQVISVISSSQAQAATV